VARAPRIAVVDYGIGNLRSAHKALVRVGADAQLTSSADDIVGADAVVLPGVGAFGACMDALRARNLEAVIREFVATGRPFLGICVGMQMLFDESEESPGVDGLGIIPGVVRYIPRGVKLPQMQWNRLQVRRNEPLFDGVGDGAWMYFVHSLYAVPRDPDVVVATCEYGTTLNAAFRHGNVFATQFHPEKSSVSGLALLSNFTKSVGDSVVRS
jgi:glutamine amidotransferase